MITSIEKNTQNNLFAVTWNGAIYKTNYDCKQFSEITRLTGTSLSFIDFSNTYNGFIIGDGNVFYTTENGGDNWNADTLKIESACNGFVALDSSKKFIVAGSQLLYCDKDNVLFATGTQFQGFKKIEKINDSTFFVFSVNKLSIFDRNGKIIDSVDFNYAPAGLESIVGIFFIRKYSWAFTVNGEILYTNDMWTSWSTICDSLKKLDFYRMHDICFVDSVRGWISGETTSDQSAVLSTVNGGRSWEVQKISYHPDNRYSFHSIEKICAKDKLQAWAMERSTLLHTNDGGKIWSEVVLPDIGMSFKDMFLNENGILWLIGLNNSVWKYTPNDVGIRFMPDKNSRKTTLTSGNANNVYEKRFKEVYDLTGRRTRISANASFINNVSAGNSRLISKGI
jgi:photosystem II stability/assembly factor-like uncharacterized protein